MCYKEPVEVWCSMHNGYVGPGDPPFVFWYEHTPNCAEDQMPETGGRTYEWVVCEECKRQREEWKRKKEKQKRKTDNASPEKMAPGNFPKTKAR
jgi:hypothetical protein